MEEVGQRARKRLLFQARKTVTLVIVSIHLIKLFSVIYRDTDHVTKKAKRVTFRQEPMWKQRRKKKYNCGLQSKPHSSTKSSERLGLLLSALPFSACCFQFPSYLMVQNGCWSSNHHTHILWMRKKEKARIMYCLVESLFLEVPHNNFFYLTGQNSKT